jgi:hypothetical protein
MGRGDHSISPIYFSLMTNKYQTQMAIVNSDNDEEGWCKVIFDLSEVAVVRPSINDELQYENTHIYFKSGMGIIIKDDYDDFIKKTLLTD